MAHLPRICSTPDCNQKHYAKRHCRKHYQQIERQNPAYKEKWETYKKKYYERNREDILAQRAASRPARLAYGAAWRANNPDSFKKWRLANPDKTKLRAEKNTLDKYGFSPEDKVNRVAAQNGKCAVCKGLCPITTKIEE